MNTMKMGKLLRGFGFVIAGLIMIILLSGCSSYGDNSPLEHSGEQTIYSDLNYTVIQNEVVKEPGGADNTEYVFIPLTIQNNSDSNIIFSSAVCIKGYAVPSGEECVHAERSAIAAAKQNVKDFVLLDGIIHSNEMTFGWLVFEVPIKTEAVKIDFYTSYSGDEYISFTCDL